MKEYFTLLLFIYFYWSIQWHRNSHLNFCGLTGHRCCYQKVLWTSETQRDGQCGGGYNVSWETGICPRCRLEKKDIWWWETRWVPHQRHLQTLGPRGMWSADEQTQDHHHPGLQRRWRLSGLTCIDIRYTTNMSKDLTLCIEIMPNAFQRRTDQYLLKMVQTQLNPVRMWTSRVHARLLVNRRAVLCDACTERKTSSLFSPAPRVSSLKYWKLLHHDLGEFSILIGWRVSIKFWCTDT